MNENQVDSIKDYAAEIDNECDNIFTIIGDSIEAIYELRLTPEQESSVIDGLFKVKDTHIKEIRRLQDRIDDEARDIETDCDCDDEPDYDNEIQANDIIQWNANNFHDQQVMEKLNELYINKFTSLQILEHLNNLCQP